MAFYRCGSSGGTFAIYHPDAFQQGTLAKSATATLSLTAYPRYLQFIRIRSGSDTIYHAWTGYDLNTMLYAWITYGASGDVSGFDKSFTIGSSDSLIQSVSNTSITVKNLVSYSIRYILMVWY